MAGMALAAIIATISPAKVSTKIMRLKAPPLVSFSAATVIVCCCPIVFLLWVEGAG